MSTDLENAKYQLLGFYNSSSWNQECITKNVESTSLVCYFSIFWKSEGYSQYKLDKGTP